MRIGWLTHRRLRSHWSYQSHRSYLSYVAETPRFAALALPLLLATGLALGARPSSRKPLPEATVLNDVDGQVIHADANDIWLFEFTSEVDSAGIKVPAGTRLPLLPSAVLERLIADVNDRYKPRYRLSASVTRYGPANFLLPTYYLPLSRFKDAGSPATVEEPNAVSEPVGPSDPNLVVPKEILELLRSRRPLRGPLRSPQARPASAENLQSRAGRADLGRMLVDRIGVVEKREGRHVFTPSGLGWKIGDTQYELLPCTTLERVLRLPTDPMDPIRFDIAGFVTRFRGKEYLLLHRAVLVYSYGNFGE